MRIKQLIRRNHADILTLKFELVYDEQLHEVKTTILAAIWDIAQLLYSIFLSPSENFITV